MAARGDDPVRDYFAIDPQGDGDAAVAAAAAVARRSLSEAQRRSRAKKSSTNVRRSPAEIAAATIATLATGGDRETSATRLRPKAIAGHAAAQEPVSPVEMRALGRRAKVTTNMAPAGLVPPVVPAATTAKPAVNEARAPLSLKGDATKLARAQLGRTSGGQSRMARPGPIVPAAIVAASAGSHATRYPEPPFAAHDLSANGQTDDDQEKSANRICAVSGCARRIRSKGLCKAHGGGRRCTVAGCERSSQSRGLCIRHGGGTRCSQEQCTKAAQSNGLCKAHGGGLRCQFQGCTKATQGGGYCRNHGGGQRCAEESCEKGAQRGGFCAGHGGTRFCQFPDCTKQDRGGGFCAEHGGGKRCEHASCAKPARRQGLCHLHASALEAPSSQARTPETLQAKSAPAQAHAPQQQQQQQQRATVGRSDQFEDI